jgi:hypothetical protein
MSCYSQDYRVATVPCRSDVLRSLDSDTRPIVVSIGIETDQRNTEMPSYSD